MRITGFILGGILFITFLILIIFSGVPSNPDHSKYDNWPLVVNDSFERYTVIAAGDAMAHMQQAVSAWDTSCNCYNYSEVYKYIHSIFKNTDLSFINFETSNGGFPYKGFPRFSSPDTIAWFLKSAGFNFFVNANNHSNDNGSKGINGTLNVFDRNNIRHTGVFRDTAEREKTYPYIIREKGFKISILNYTYSTNGINTPAPAIVNIIDTIQMKKDMRSALDSMPDVVLVLMHWGSEYQREAGHDQKVIADFLFRNGADVIIGSHPHVIQPIEFYKFNYLGKPKTGLVIWSLGNFVAHQRRRYANGGIFVRFDIARNIYTGKIKIDNVYYIPFWLYKQPNPLKFYVLPVSLFEHDSTTFNMHDTDRTVFNTFITDTRLHLARDTANIKELFLK